MKPKQLLFVVIAFAVLGGLYLLQQSKQPEAIQDLGYVTLGVPSAEIEGVKCYLAGQEEQAVVLAKKEGEWVVDSKFGAKAATQKIEDFLKKIGDLEGELRSSSEAVLGDYGIADDEVLHLDLLDSGGDTLKHLLIGNQGPGYQEMFVRLAGETNVYLANENLRGDFGLYGQQPANSLDGKPWVETKLMEIPQEDISRIETQTPYRDLILEYQAVYHPAVGDATDAPPPEPEYVPVLVEPVVEAATKQAGIDRLARAFGTVNISDVMDRGGLAKYGLENPQASVKVTTRDGQVHQLYVGRAAPGGGHYVMREGDDLVYKMDRWKLESIFLKLSDLADFSVPAFKDDAITEFNVQQGGSRIEFTRQDEQWQAKDAAVADRLNADKVEKIVSGLSDLRPQDQATKVEASVTGLDRPAAIVEFVMDDGSKHKIAFGAAVPLTDSARFFQLDDGPEVYTLTKATYQDMTPSAGDLFDLSLFDWKALDAYKITLNDASGELQLGTAMKAPITETGEMGELGESKWVIRGKESAPLEQAQVLGLLTGVAGMKGQDFIAAKEGGFDSSSWKIEITTKDDKVHTLEIGKAAKPGLVAVRADDGKQAFLVPSFQVQRLKQLGLALRPKEAVVGE